MEWTEVINNPLTFSHTGEIEKSNMAADVQLL